MYCSHQCSQRSYKVRLREQKFEKVLQKENLPPVISTTLKKEYLLRDDVADLMGVSSTTVYRYCITGENMRLNKNKKILIIYVDVSEFWVDGRTFKPKSYMHIMSIWKPWGIYILLVRRGWVQKLLNLVNSWIVAIFTTI